MSILLHPGYFLNIANFVVIANNDVCWEVNDNYQKQTFRNRTYIAADVGKHMLNIPIKHVSKTEGKQKYKDIKVENDYAWQRQHWRTLETAYRTSAFFEFYEDEIVALYEKKHTFLLDLNLETTALICDCLQIDMPTQKTAIFEKEAHNLIDGRFLISSKTKIKFNQENYFQVFNDRNGFTENCSILDLLFNEGTNALSYLKNHSIEFKNA
ncbi:WbqC family protein [Cellulophaga sp. 20_2_10]|uniref:WbqC family protein n=1 Tax=Cellulophaga sp. 20_2_10 TaxID=2942476 RepID=UPI00201AA781|nr:WbqC family protein [Cellulophaga sp. 20_2_10]MCL5246098.1 WbqC family protein [Cellulophaga sp. 20_2_10]